MNPKLIPWLQRVFWILGWALLVLAALSIATEVFHYFYFSGPSPTELPLRKHEFNFLKQSRLLFSSLGQAFFAFLVSAVFDMVFHRAPVRTQQTERFLRVACLGFVGDGFLGLISWVNFGSAVFSTFGSSMRFNLMSGLHYLLGLFPILMPFVYAVTIYVLFTHFSQLVTFESEVV